MPGGACPPPGVGVRLLLLLLLLCNPRAHAGTVAKVQREFRADETGPCLEKRGEGT